MASVRSDLEDAVDVEPYAARAAVGRLDVDVAGITADCGREDVIEGLRRLRVGVARCCCRVKRL